MLSHKRIKTSIFTQKATADKAVIAFLKYNKKRLNPIQSYKIQTEYNLRLYILYHKFFLISRENREKTLSKIKNILKLLLYLF